MSNIVIIKRPFFFYPNRKGIEVKDLDYVKNSGYQESWVINEYSIRNGKSILMDTLQLTEEDYQQLIDELDALKEQK